MESIIGRQKVFRRRSPGVREAGVERTTFVSERLGPRKSNASPFVSARLPVFAKRTKLPSLDVSRRSQEFRQYPAARKSRPFDRDTRTAGRRGFGKSGMLRVLRRTVSLPMRALHGLSPRARLLLALAALFLGLALSVAMIILHPAIPLPQGNLLPQDGTNDELLLAYVTPRLGSNGGTGDAKGPAVEAAADLPPPPATLELKSYTIQKNDSAACPETGSSHNARE